MKRLFLEVGFLKDLLQDLLRRTSKKESLQIAVADLWEFAE
jgi:hypothetical protein